MSTNADRSERWKRAVIGPLAPDFLRLHTPQEIQEAVDRQTAAALQQQQAIISRNFHDFAPNIVGRLSVTITQAKLVKNYGLSRMDPYVRIRVGHFIYETQTDPNGGKNPRWNRVIHTQLPAGVNSIYLEIYDECNFTMDELIAWVDVKIPESVMRGETNESWFALSGKQGEGQEGQIQLVMSFSNTPAPYLYQSVPPVVMNVGSGRPILVSQQPAVIQQQQPPHPAAVAGQPAQPVPPPQLTEEDIQQIAEMFPNVDKEVIVSVSQANRGNREATINSLLQMTN